MACRLNEFFLDCKLHKDRNQGLSYLVMLGAYGLIKGVSGLSGLRHLVCPVVSQTFIVADPVQALKSLYTSGSYFSSLEGFLQ